MYSYSTMNHFIHKFFNFEASSFVFVCVCARARKREEHDSTYTLSNAT